MTVKPLESAELPAFIALADRAPASLMPVRLHLEAHGLREEGTAYWSVFRGDAMVCVVMRMSTMAVCTGDPNESHLGAAVANLIDAQRGLLGLRAPLPLADEIASALSRYACTGRQESYFMRLTRPVHHRLPLFGHAVAARRAGIEDLDALASLYSGADIMYRSRSNVQERLENSRVFLVEDAEAPGEGRVAAAALLNAEGDTEALIGGVFTRHTRRNRGFAAAAVSALCADIQQAGKTPCLFYENSVAGRLYRRLGFEIAERWTVLFISPRRPL